MGSRYDAQVNAGHGGRAGRRGSDHRVGWGRGASWRAGGNRAGRGRCVGGRAGIGWSRGRRASHRHQVHLCETAPGPGGRVGPAGGRRHAVDGEVYAITLFGSLVRQGRPVIAVDGHHAIDAGRGNGPFSTVDPVRVIRADNCADRNRRTVQSGVETVEIRPLGSWRYLRRQQGRQEQCHDPCHKHSERHTGSNSSHNPTSPPPHAGARRPRSAVRIALEHYSNRPGRSSRPACATISQEHSCPDTRHPVCCLLVRWPIYGMIRTCPG